MFGNFNLKNKEWDNFSSYYNDKIIKENEKVLKKEILEKQMIKILKIPMKQRCMQLYYLNWIMIII